jgi:hypothetical protein
VRRMASADRQRGECPICFRSMQASRTRDLYGAEVCCPCFNRFVHLRIVAFVIDFLAYASLGLAAQFLLFGSVGGVVRRDPSWFDVCVNAGFCAFMLLRDSSLWLSPGKRLLGLRTVDAQTGESAGVTQSMKRNLWFGIPGVWVWAAMIAGAEIYLGGGRPRDRAAHTKVVWCKHAHAAPFLPQALVCRRCAYNLTGNVSGRCPECGTEVPAEARQLILTTPTNLAMDEGG